jgi:3',5'-cyclic-AMP phosphodiesterase
MLRLIQISDSHLIPRSQAFRYGRDPYNQLEIVVSHIKSQARALDLVIHTGDLCGLKSVHATTAEYFIARDILDQLPCAYLVIPGNHDDKELLAEIVRPDCRLTPVSLSPRIKYLRIQNYSIVLADTADFDKRAGRLEDEDLVELSQFLSNASPKSVFIFAHHPILPVISPWIDNTMCLEKADELHQLLDRFADRVLGVFHGHIHREAVVSSGSVTYYSCPSTWVNYSMALEAEELSQELYSPYGYREIRHKENLVTSCFGLEVENVSLHRE